MMTGIVVSNSILIVEFAGHLHEEGLPVAEAVVQSCKIRPASDSDDIAGNPAGDDPDGVRSRGGERLTAPLARAIIGGLGVSVRRRFSWCPPFT